MKIWLQNCNRTFVALSQNQALVQTVTQHYVNHAVVLKFSLDQVNFAVSDLQCFRPNQDRVQARETFSFGRMKASFHL